MSLGLPDKSRKSAINCICMRIVSGCFAGRACSVGQCYLFGWAGGGRPPRGQVDKDGVERAGRQVCCAPVKAVQRVQVRDWSVALPRDRSRQRVRASLSGCLARPGDPHGDRGARPDMYAVSRNPVVLSWIGCDPRQGRRRFWHPGRAGPN